MVVGADKQYFELRNYLIQQISSLEKHIRDLYNQQCSDNGIDIIKAETELSVYVYLLKEF